MKNILLIVVLLGICIGEANAGIVTDQVIRKVVEAKREGAVPVVVLDLDDTLFDSRTRKAIIFREFAQLLLNEGRDRAIARTLSGLRLENYHYGVEETLVAAGIGDSGIHKELLEFWRERFFTDRYVALDLEIPGAANFVQSLAEHGAKVVYLTGRDTRSMRGGTVESLRARGFPDALLLTKPQAEMDDLEFKEQALREVGRLGEVVAVFENEPVNLNLMMKAFPSADGVFLDTLHSLRPTRPSPKAKVISDYL